jgi:DNA-binding transcriptional LysR family regulator
MPNCVAMIPRSMLESMPGSRNVNAYPLSEAFRYLNIWLTWRRGVRSTALDALINLVQTAIHEALPPASP